MSNAFDTLASAIEEHEMMQRAVRNSAGKMAKLLVGHLRDSNIVPWILEDLKRELADYNIHTKRWKK